MPAWFDFKTLRAQLDFAQVLRFYGVELNVNGNQHLGFCPLPTHDGKKNSPSFSANLKKGIFQCFGCKACGNIFDFATLMEGHNPKNGRSLYSVACKLKRHFVNTDGVSRPTKKAVLKGPIEGQQDLFPPVQRKVEINSPLDFTLKDLDAEHPYLKSRGFSRETMDRFGVGFCSRGFLKDRIAISIHNEEGNLVGYAGRTLADNTISVEHPKYKLPTSRERNGMTLEFQRALILYNSHRIAEPVSDLIVVEGFSSVWWLYQAGFSNVVAIMGNSCSDTQVELIVAKTKPDGCIWIIPGNHHAGLRCASGLLSQLAPHRMVRWVKLKGGCKPTSYTLEELQNLLPIHPEKSGPIKRSSRSIKMRLLSREIQSRHAIVELANSFPGLAKLGLKPDTWDAIALDGQCKRFSSGERAAVQFVLNVWNGHQEWQSGVFDVVSAVDIWDSKNREAFLGWVADPWWC